ncbi:MAG: glycoside hydrolase family 32 protein, partial [Chloroflexi bacterium]|nr:glycoside hydrolase family 32 protein [Chloroflexota bacterium]
PANWLNDPNGLIYWKGQYHLFYQYNPHGPFHSTIHWGHAVSADLVHWHDLPIALTPTPDGPDHDGCWSGCAVDHAGTPTLIYTGVHPQTVCLATSADDLLTWQKYAGNPVIAAPPIEVADKTGGDFRDPFVWQEIDGWWYLVIGSRVEGAGGQVLLYRSTDLIQWEYLHPLLKGDVNRTEPIWTGVNWECPNFFAVGDKHVLVISAQASSNELLFPVYFVGDYQGQHFEPITQAKLVDGRCFYAPQFMRAPDGRMIMWGWLREGRADTAALAAGWSGVMSIPITVSLRSDNQLKLEPAAELKALRGKHWHYENLEINADRPGLPDEVHGNCLEIEAEFEPEAAAEFGLTICCSPDGEEHTHLVYQTASKRLVVEIDHSSLSPAVDRDPLQSPIELDAAGRLRIHLFLDHSVLEVFVNETLCLASRIYPTRADSLGVRAFARNGRTRLNSMDVWSMSSIWKS